MNKKYQIQPLTKNQWRRLRRQPVFVWKTYARDMRLMMGFSCVLVSLLLVGCNLTPTVGMGPKAHKVAPERSLDEPYEVPVTELWK